MLELNKYYRRRCGGVVYTTKIINAWQADGKVVVLSEEMKLCQGRATNKEIYAIRMYSPYEYKTKYVEISLEEVKKIKLELL